MALACVGLCAWRAEKRGGKPSCFPDAIGNLSAAGPNDRSDTCLLDIYTE